MVARHCMLTGIVLYNWSRCLYLIVRVRGQSCLSSQVKLYPNEASSRKVPNWLKRTHLYQYTCTSNQLSEIVRVRVVGTAVIARVHLLKFVFHRS